MFELQKLIDLTSSSKKAMTVFNFLNYSTKAKDSVYPNSVCYMAPLLQVTQLFLQISPDLLGLIQLLVFSQKLYEPYHWAALLLRTASSLSTCLLR